MLANVNSSQRAMAEIIEREFTAAGYDQKMVVAAILNAIAESGLNPKAAGDGGQSIGLFQLYAKGAGAGMSVADRQDPVKNTRRIIEEVRRYGKPLLDAIAAGKSSADITALFCIYIERPQDSKTKGAYRAATLPKYFPTLGQQWLPGPAQTGYAKYALPAAGSVALLAVVGALWWRFRR
jgi:hypothetical protein